MKHALPRPETLEHRTFLALLQAHEALQAEAQQCFKAAGLTDAQFNTLRILLRGPEEGCSCQQIGDELLKRVPDVTRLIDRMERAGLVTRERSQEDRRVVRVRITPAGQQRAEALYEPLGELHARQFAHLSAQDTDQLNRLLRTLFRER
ncbi:MAG: MarR family transcriptional regulator [Planctomycetes bacterium]|nr:MarR family transcriptional regulator [Planctomycetota bacterium]MCB9904960.1 MarR family transcriptional regulator [Planctomycetota bacterium]